MPRTPAKQAKYALQETPPPADGLDTGSMVKELLPFLPGMIRTLGLSAAPKTGADGNESPGDIRAAIAGLDLVLKYLMDTPNDQAAKVVSEIRKLREAALAEAKASTSNPD